MLWSSNALIISTKEPFMSSLLKLFSMYIKLFFCFCFDLQSEVYLYNQCETIGIGSLSLKFL